MGPLINTPLNVTSWSSVDGGGGGTGIGTDAWLIPCRLRENNGRRTIFSKLAVGRAAVRPEADEGVPNHSARGLADLSTDPPPPTEPPTTILTPPTNPT